MLSPEYLLRVSEGGEEIAENLHNSIIEKIIKRIMLRLDRGDGYILTPQDKWQIQVLEEAGFLLEDIKKEISKATGLMQEEIAEAMEDAGVKTLEYDHAVYEAAGLSPKALEESPALLRILQRTFEATVGEWENFTRTTADAAQQAFIKACDSAYIQVATGAVSYSEALKDVINQIVSEGVEVVYPTGHTDSIETATLRCIRTGVSQASGEISNRRMDEMGWDIILVSSHLGARVTKQENYTNHFWWQGKFYSKSGTDPRFPPFSLCGMGHVQGLHGANCRHSHGPGDGEFNPYEQYDSEENLKEFELQQRQRTLERRIRKTKRETMGKRTAMENAKTEEAREKLEREYQKSAALLQKQNKAYNEFCEENGLKRLNERLTIAKWDRSQAAKARAAAKKRVDSVGEAASTSNWYTIPVAGGQTNTKYRILSGAKTIDENAAAVNPGYHSGKAEYKNNCQRCVPAYEMRRRGYDVVARPAVVDETGKLSPRDPLYTKWKNVFQNAKFRFCSGYDKGKSEIIRQMEDWGDGAVAEVRVLWKDNRAHVFVAEMHGGTVKFIDPQNGKECGNYFTDAALGGTMIARIDNLEPSSLIELCIKNRGGK